MESIAEERREGNSFEESYVRELWKEVRDDFWGDLKVETQRALKRLLETGLEVEVQDLIGTRHWEHKRERIGYRNGYYNRGLLTGFGYLEDLRVPRIREGGIRFKSIRRYRQRSEEIDKMVKEMFLQGVGTRKVKEVLEPIVGKNALSSTTVSRITKELDREVMKFHNRRLRDEYKYLILDGIYLNAKSVVYKKRRCVLVCYGIKEGGQKELIDFYLTKKGESEEGWEYFLNRLYHRGLEGKELKLVCIDGNKGLYNAVRNIYPEAKVQRCWVHKLKNVANKCPRRIEEEVIRGARKIYSATDKRGALEAYVEWDRKWREVVPKAVECLEDDLEELLTFYEEPEEWRKKLRTTNIIERVFREVRRRTRPMGCFQNRESVERIIFAIFNRQNKIWENSREKITQNP